MRRATAMTTHLQRQQRNVRLYVSAVSAIAIAIFVLLVRIDLADGLSGLDWPTMFLFGALFAVSEAYSTIWMRFGDDGEVTPGWAFAYAMLLLGFATGAIVIGIVTTFVVGIRHRKGPLKIVFNAAQLTISLACGAFVLRAFGITGSITETDTLPLMAGLGVILGGFAIFMLNGVITAGVIGLHEGVGFRATMRAGFALSMTADGALLALAPVFVIAVEFSIVMLPLMGVTSFLVYQSARTALQREHEATHDPLTKLLNRRAFDARVAEVLDTAEPGSLAILVMDLDRFKDINDRLGHHVGDLLLISFASRLERTLPSRAIASRLGGDEFGVMFPGVHDVSEAWEMVRRLHEQLDRVHDIDGFPLSVDVSVGFTVGPESGATAESMVAAADVAMYRAKHNESRVEIQSRTTECAEHGRVGLLPDLNQAIANSELTVNYQPLVALDGGRLVGVEALVRWEHPVHGNIPPSEFIGLAEQTDLIDSLTYEMFRRAMSELLSLGDLMPDLSINVSPRSLLDRHFATGVLELTVELGFPAHQLEIEVTERSIMIGSERTALAVDTLRSAGVSVAVDDFGSGYSSFRVLRQVSTDRLKIDREFTSLIDESEADRVIVTKMIELAHGLGLDVVAEGVETTEVWQRRRALGCDIAQGYGIARPMPLAALQEWILDRSDLRRHAIPVPDGAPAVSVGGPSEHHANGETRAP